MSKRTEFSHVEQIAEVFQGKWQGRHVIIISWNVTSLHSCRRFRPQKPTAETGSWDASTQTTESTNNYVDRVNVPLKKQIDWVQYWRATDSISSSTPCTS